MPTCTFLLRIGHCSCSLPCWPRSGPQVQCTAAAAQQPRHDGARAADAPACCVQLCRNARCWRKWRFPPGDSEGWANSNRFGHKVADFILCSQQLRVIAVIELDDSSHAGRDRQHRERDAMLKLAAYAALRYAPSPRNRRCAPLSGNC